MTVASRPERRPSGNIHGLRETAQPFRRGTARTPESDRLLRLRNASLAQRFRAFGAGLVDEVRDSMSYPKRSARSATWLSNSRTSCSDHWSTLRLRQKAWGLLWRSASNSSLGDLGREAEKVAGFPIPGIVEVLDAQHAVALRRQPVQRFERTFVDRLPEPRDLADLRHVVPGTERFAAGADPGEEREEALRGSGPGSPRRGPDSRRDTASGRSPCARRRSPPRRGAGSETGTSRRTAREAP